MSERKSEIMKSIKLLVRDLDLSSTLQWQYWLLNVPKRDVADMMEHLTAEGYVEVSSCYNDLDNPPKIVDENTLFCVMFAFVGVHDAESASNQIEHLCNWADSRGYFLMDYAVGELTKTAN